MDLGKTKYTAGAGTIELRKAVCNKLLRENSLKANPNEILISNGEKQSLYLTCQALFQAGDEVLIFKPYWVSFPEFVTLSDASPIIVKTHSKNNFEPNIEDLKSLIELLPADQMEVLKMRYFEELSFKKIAQKIDVSINTALGRMRYALINLRALSKKHHIDLHIKS